MYDYHLRPVNETDIPALLAIYVSTRREEVARTGWPRARQQAFLGMQARAQHEHYALHYPEAVRQIIEVRQEITGRLYVSDWDEEIRIVDIALLPAYCNSGLGTVLLKTLQRRAAEAGKPLTIHVEKNNPAARLYQRLGFTEKTDKGVYLLMRWRPDD